LRVPFCEFKTVASCTTVPTVGRGGHCAVDVKQKHPHISTIGRNLETHRIFYPHYSTKLS
jgi:hypothetical protein